MIPLHFSWMPMLWRSPVIVSSRPECICSVSSGIAILNQARKTRMNKAQQKPAPQTVTIEKESIPVVPDDIPLDELKLDRENPRIRENLKKRTGKGGAVSQDELRKMILELPGVSSLQRSIRETKGLHEP